MASENVHERNRLPADAVIQMELEIVGYFGEDGALKLAYRSEGNVPISTMVGLMEQTKFALLRTWDDQTDFEDIPEGDDGEN